MEVTDNAPASAVGGEPPEVERLRDELGREHEMHLRTLADFDNYRRRVERDREIASQAGKRGLALSLLDVVDNFEGALAHMTNAPYSVAAGMQAIHRKLLAALESHGVTPFGSLGETFNPELHEAIGSVASEAFEPGIVADELQKGYLWGDELLRPARVRVAQ